MTSSGSTVSRGVLQAMSHHTRFFLGISNGAQFPSEFVITPSLACIQIRDATDLADNRIARPTMPIARKRPRQKVGGMSNSTGLLTRLLDCLLVCFPKCLLDALLIWFVLYDFSGLLTFT